MAPLNPCLSHHCEYGRSRFIHAKDSFSRGLVGGLGRRYDTLIDSSGALACGAGLWLTCNIVLQ